ncbi:uncharacterized protein LOC129784534, partial [Falco peregrinus]|uniref:uncharacterized protein LOC129784534 n=1 Tax=Falco peregrinus TaxID=8954 RepID=UPI0024791FB9
MSWPDQSCCTLTSGAQDGLTFLVAPADMISERTTEFYDPPSTSNVPGPRDPGKFSIKGAVAAIISLQVQIVLGCVWIWWRRKKKAPVAGASRVQQETRGSHLHLDSQSSGPGSPQSWTERQQTLPPEQQACSASPWPGCPPSPFAATLEQRSQTSTLQPPAKRQWPSRPPSPFPDSVHQRNQKSVYQLQQSPRPPRPPPLPTAPSPLPRTPNPLNPPPLLRPPSPPSTLLLPRPPSTPSPPPLPSPPSPASPLPLPSPPSPSLLPSPPSTLSLTPLP